MDKNINKVSIIKNKKFVNIQTMQISLPPGTGSLPQTGNLILTLTPLFFNSSLPSLKYFLKLWGLQNPITLQPISTKINNNQQNPTNNKQYSYTFRITTNLKKLTQYFTDMNVILIEIRDARSLKQIGISYLKIKRFIVNGSLSQFQQKIQILQSSKSGAEGLVKKIIIGEIILKMKLDVPLNVLPKVIQNKNIYPIESISNNIPNLSQITPKNQKLIHKLIIQPNVFQQAQSNNLKQFTIYKNNKNKQIKQDQSQNQQDYQNIDIRNILSNFKTKTKITKQNVLNFIEEDSIQQYPDIDVLKRKYGNNNVCIERMKLKLDQAKYLNNQKKIQSNYKNNTVGGDKNGFIMKFMNFHLLVSGSNTGNIQDFHIVQYVSEKDQNVITEGIVKGISQGGYFIKKIVPGNIIQIQNQLYKGRSVIRKSNLQGQQIKVYLKRKDNNKKSIQFDILIQNLSKYVEFTKPQSQKIQKSQAPPKQQIVSNDKSHFYISIKPLEQTKYTQLKQPNIIIHPQCQKNAVSGKKMIFIADNICQNIKIEIKSQQQFKQNQQKIVKIDPSIKMKQEVIQIGKKKYKIFMAVEQNMENLMKIIVMHDGINMNQGNMNQGNINKDNNIKRDQSNFKQNQIFDQNLSRQQKLSLIFNCFQSLLTSTNSQCMQLFKKLSNPSLTSDQQIDLFLKLCQISNTSQPELTTNQAFKQLLHGEFSMFWSCFVQYKKWNQIYWHTVAGIKRKILSKLKIMINSSQSKNRNKTERLLQKIIEKLYKNKETLFGLISISTCQTVISQYLNNHFMNQQQQQQPIKIIQNSSLQPSKLQSQIFQQLIIQINSLLTLLCRYKNVSDNHSIKIDQLTYILFQKLNQNRPFMNQHQILAISQKRDQQIQLLFQLTQSCLAEIDRDGKINECKGLRMLLQQWYKFETEQSSRNQQNQRFQTENITHKIYTQQIQRMHTQQIIQINKKSQQSHLHTDQNIKPKPPIKLYLTKLQLNPDLNRFVTIIPPQNIQIKIIQPDNKKCLYKLTQSQLPKQINLREMQDYLVTVKVYDNEIKQNINQYKIKQHEQLFKFQGVFIANTKIEKIVLYQAIQGRGQRQQYGYLKVGIQEQKDLKNDDELIIQIKNQEIFQKQVNLQSSSHLNRQFQNQQVQRDRLTREITQKILTCPIIQYKILSISPHQRSSQQFLILIQGALQPIRYPTAHSIGKIINDSPQKSRLNISIENGHQNIQRLHQSFPKTEGIYEICFCKSNGVVYCVVTIELQQYIGNDVAQKHEQNLTRYILLNIYHMDSIRKLNQISKQFTIVVTTDSKQQPIYIKDWNFEQKNKEYPTNILGIQNNKINLHIRSMWIGLTTRIDVSKKYEISVYRKQKARGMGYIEQNLIANFEFKIKFHPNQIGVFQNKGYLMDKKGYRLALNVLQINYNDIFSKDLVGRKKFEVLFSIFQIQNLLKLSRNCTSKQSLKSSIRNNLGFNNTQLHLLFQLEPYQNKILNIVKNWDTSQILNREQVDMLNYSISDLYSEYQIYDFSNSGAIPKSKIEIVNKLVFGNEKQRNININNFLIEGKQGWVRDIKNVESNGQIDYLLILWCLKKCTKVDNFFILTQESNTTIYLQKFNHLNQSSTNPHNNNQNISETISKIKPIKISLLAYKNLKINNLPATLIFYINGQKVAQPIPRCFTYQYQAPKTILTSWPIIVQVYNKKYGVKQLYSEQLVQSIRVYEQKVKILDGEMYFMIEEDDESNLNINKNQKKNQIDKYNQDYHNSNTNFKQSRRQKWQNLKQSRQQTQKIADILSKITA